MKYPLLTLRTLRILFTERPAFVFAQSPPVFCPAAALLYCSVTGSKLVVDAHTQARIWSLFESLTRRVLKRAAAVLVSNEEERARLAEQSIRAFVLSDPIPNLTFANVTPLSLPGIAMVASFSDDEPLVEVIEAAVKLPHVHIYVTGDPRFGRRSHLAASPPNVHYTGFLDYDNYLALLRSVDAVMVLTKKNNTMLSGAGEALAVGTPLITSNWSVLRNYFDRGAVHIGNTAEQIVAAVGGVLLERDRLAGEMKDLRSLRQREWERQFAELLKLLELV